MSVRTVCLGWQWVPYSYRRTVDDVGTPARPFPEWLGDLGRKAVADASGDRGAGERYRPELALVNYYDAAAKMGMHQDKDEASPAPVVSLSLGDTAIFRFGNTEGRNRPWRDIELASGDLFVFGGESRRAFHGVTRILPGTGDPSIGLDEGRLNVTLRELGLDPVEPRRRPRTRADR
ncbi:MAG: alkylated repair protein [Acidimicrobiaceae bacterium]|nr:alkylated repair protein [Acidimicrobiaceae bacterium]